MTIEQRTVAISASVIEALDLCVQALEKGRFKDIQLDQDNPFITARRKPSGQITPGQVTISVVPTQQGSQITPYCEEVA